MKSIAKMRFTKTLVSILLVIVLLFATACNPDSGNSGTGGGGGTGDEDKTGVKALRITTNPRTEYAEGEVFSTAGMVIVADWYGDDEPEELWPGEYTYTHNGETLTRDITEIVFSYEDATCKLPITVTPRDVTGIEILSKPEPYVIGENGKDDFKVKTTCSDGEGWELSSDQFTLGDQFNASAITEYTSGVTVTYKLGQSTFTKTEELSVVRKLFAKDFVEEDVAEAPEDNSHYVTSLGGRLEVDGTVGLNTYNAASAQNGGEKSMSFHFYSKHDEVSATFTMRIANGRRRGNSEADYYYDTAVLADHATVEMNGEQLDTTGIVLPGCTQSEYQESRKNHATSDEARLGALNYTTLEWNVTLSKGYNTFTIANKAASDANRNGWICLEIDYLGVEIDDEHFGEWTVDKTPTCEEQGHRYRNCAECGEYEEEILTTSHEITGIEIDTPPTTTKYMWGDMFDATGMVIRANCSKPECAGFEVPAGDYTVSAITAAGQKSVTVTYAYQGVRYTVEQPIDMPDVIEAEWAKDGHTHGDTDHWVEASASGAKANTNAPVTNPASNGKYLGDWMGASQTLTFHIYADHAGNAKIYLRGASGSRKGTSGNWTGMNPMNLSELLTLTLNGSRVSISEDAIWAGYEDGEFWYNWTTVALGVYALNEGYNTLVITIAPQSGLLGNVDCMEIEFDTDEPLSPLPRITEIIEAEWAKTKTEHGETEHWVEASRSGIGTGWKGEDGTSKGISGGSYLSDWVGTNQTLTFHIYAESAGRVQLYFRTAIRITDSQDAKLNEYLSLSVNGEDKAIPDEAVIVYQNSQWYSFTEMDLGTFDLNQGYNTITFTVIKSQPMNTDYLKVVFGA